MKECLALLSGVGKGPCPRLLTFLYLGKLPERGSNTSLRRGLKEAGDGRAHKNPPPKEGTSWTVRRTRAGSPWGSLLVLGASASGSLVSGCCFLDASAFPKRGGELSVAGLVWHQYYGQAPRWRWEVARDPPTSVGKAGDVGSILGSGRSPREGNGNLWQCSCLENPMDRGAWRATYSSWGGEEPDTTEHLSTIAVVRISMSSTIYFPQIQGEETPTSELNGFQWFEQKMYEQCCNRSNAYHSYSWDSAIGSVSSSKNVFFSRTWGYLY